MKKLLMIMLVLVLSMIFVGPILARDGERGREYRGHERYKHYRYYGGRYYAPPPVIITPGYADPYYAPLPGYYTPNPYPPPGITFVIPLHIH